MPPNGFGAEGTSGRDTTGLSNAWGTRGSSLIRSILNYVVPVTVVERWYDDLTGSLFGQTANAPGANTQRPSVEFFSASRDWELHAVNAWYPIKAVEFGANPTEYQITLHLFTAFGGYNPIEFVPTALTGPQLILNQSFNQGTVRGQGGSNAVNAPFGAGWILANEVHRTRVHGTGTVSQLSDSWGRGYVSGGGVEREIATDKKLQNHTWFQRPIRVLRNRRITFQLIGTNDVFVGTPITFLTVSILYSELPNPRESYRT